MLIPLLTGPLYTVIFTMVLRHGGRADLGAYAVIAPFFMSLWWFAIFHGGWVITNERWEGTVDYLVAAPVGFASVVLGRIATIVLARSAATFSNSLSYPFYVLGGILVPITLLPGWLQPVSKVIFLSWSSRSLRDSLAAAPIQGVGLNLAMIFVLGSATLVLATAMLARVLRQVRQTGELGLR